MTLEKARTQCKNYSLVVRHAEALLPKGSPEKTIRQASWLYIQYGCNTYTDGPGFPFRPEDVRDALPVSREEGVELAEQLRQLGVLEALPSGRYRFTSQWI